MTRQLARWTEALGANGWPAEYAESGLLKSSPHEGREGHGALAICTPGLAIAFDGVLGRLGSERPFPWNTVQLFDATDDSYRMATFGFGTELGAATFMSDRPWFPGARGPSYRGPRNDLADKVRPHLPSDGWESPFKWSLHDVTRTKEDLANFVLAFLTSHTTRSVSAWQVVPADQVAARCLEVLGRAEAYSLFQALGLSSVEDRVSALDDVPSLQDAGLLLVWFRTLAGVVEEGMDLERTMLSDARGELVASFRDGLG